MTSEIKNKRVLILERKIISLNIKKSFQSVLESIETKQRKIGSLKAKTKIYNKAIAFFF